MDFLAQSGIRRRHISLTMNSETAPRLRFGGSRLPLSPPRFGNEARKPTTPGPRSVLELVPAEELDWVLHTYHPEIATAARDAVVNGVAE